MSCVSEYVPQLRARGFRMTRQRMAILHVLRHEGAHLSPRHIYQEALKELPTLTEPTVYRTLEFLAQNGFVRPSHSTHGHLTYEIAEEEHHHIICRSCGREVEVEHTLLEKLYQVLESASGYCKIDSHITFFGVCPNCDQD